jgi:hypothetical protein
MACQSWTIFKGSIGLLSDLSSCTMRRSATVCGVATLQVSKKAGLRHTTWLTVEEASGLSGPPSGQFQVSAWSQESAQDQARKGPRLMPMTRVRDRFTEILSPIDKITKAAYCILALMQFWTASPPHEAST